MKVYWFLEELICVAEYWTTDLIYYPTGGPFTSPTCWNPNPVFSHRGLLNEKCSVMLIQCLCAITHY